MRKQNSYRKINEDVAALRNIAWAIVVGPHKNTAAVVVLQTTTLLLALDRDNRTPVEIWAILAQR